MKNKECPGCGSTQTAAFDIIPPNGKVSFLGAMIIMEDPAPLAERLFVPPDRDYSTPIYAMAGIGLVCLMITLGGEYYPEFSVPPVLGINALKNTSWSALGIVFFVASFVAYMIYINIAERNDYVKSVKKFSGRRCRRCRHQWRG